MTVISLDESNPLLHADIPTNNSAGNLFEAIALERLVSVIVTFHVAW